MKASLLSPQFYSITKSIDNSLRQIGYTTNYLDFNLATSFFENKINPQIFRFPYSYRNKWNSYFLNKINKWYIEQFKDQNPDLVFIYNNEMILPETLNWLKNKNVKIAFFLGDNPLYTHTSDYNLAVLEYADAIFVPDTFWMHQLKKMGIERTYHLILPLPEHSYFPVENIDMEYRKQIETDVLYVGTSYVDSWGYKKAKFINCFTNSKLQIHGSKGWKRWFPYFPDLEKYFIEKKQFIPVNVLNLMFNCTKIIPVDGNPGIFNGLHIRVMEALAAGALPIMEYNSDMDIVFKGVSDLPAVKSYKEIPEMVTYYLNNERERLAKVDAMKTLFKQKYTIENLSKKIHETITGKS